MNLDTLQFSVYNITVPRLEVPAHQLHIYGQNYNVTSHDRPAYPPAVVNFAVDNEFKNYWVLWKWQQLIHESLTSEYANERVFPNGAPDEPRTLYTTDDHIVVQEKKPLYNYTTDIVVYGKDEYNNNKIKFHFKWAFISRLGELVYNYRDPGETDCYFEFVFNQIDIELM